MKIKSAAMYVLWLFLVFLNHANPMPSDFGSVLSFNDSWYSGKSMIHSSSRRFKANDIENSVFLLDRLSPLDGSRGLQYCRRNATCQPLPKGSTCLGAKLPYNSSTLELVPVLVESHQQMLDHFAVWKGLIHLPRCWAVIQPFLCSLYMPRCENNLVDLPSEEMCKVMLGPCRILTEQNAWPLALKCDNNTDFPSGCKNDVREIKFNSSGRCQEPLVATNSPSSYYEEMESCGVQCDNPMFTADERFQIHRLVAWAATICLLFNLFTVVTFMIEWSSSQYPALITFYINLCFLIVCLGWLAQFLPGGREDIVCRKDGTLRIGEPNARENLSCVVVFVLVYYFLMAGIVWFVIFTYAYHISFQSLGKIFPGRAVRMDKKGAYFHLVAWSLPLVLTITTMALGEIDGDSVTGICFVGSVNHVYRGILFLLPVFSALAIGGYFLFKGLIKLIAIQITSQEVVSVRATAKIRETIVRWGFFSVLIFIFGFVSFVCHIYKFRNSSLWDESFKKFIVCKLVYSTTTECRQEARPSLAILQLQVLALFATGIAMSSWVWTNSSWQAWKRFFARLTNKKTEEAPVKLIKHKVIAQAFAKRKMLNSAGRLSISIHSSYPDPVGLNFELNSMASGNLSSTWAAALPKLVTRRGALAGVTNSNSSQRRNSMDSEISYSVRRVSVESRRHSLDSAVSVQVAELTKTVRKARPSHRHRVRGRRRRRSRAGSRRGSSTSQDSQGDAQILQALTIGGVDIPPVSSLVHNQSRRQAIAGLDDNLDILAVKLFGNLAGPLGISHSSDGSSEEVTQVRETLITGRFQTNTNTNTISGYSDDDKAAEEEDEVDSDDVTQLLTKSNKNKRDCDVQISKISSRSNKSEVENEREKRNKKRESEGRNSKLSNKSNLSDTSRQTCDGQVDERSNRSELKREKANYPSCSDLENCTDDAKWIQSEGEGKGSSRKINVSVATNCSLIPEQLNYTYQSASTVSVGSHPQHGREIGTQTNVSFNNKDRSASTCSKPKRKKSNASRNKPSSTDSSLK